MIICDLSCQASPEYAKSGRILFRKKVLQKHIRFELRFAKDKNFHKVLLKVAVALVVLALLSVLLYPQFSSHHNELGSWEESFRMNLGREWFGR